MKTSFSQWSLRPELQAALLDLHFDTPTDVQQQTFQPTLEGHDVMVQSRTGSGKTLAFTLPLLHKMGPRTDGVSVLVILPTRELCMQVAATMKRVGAFVDVRVAAVYGGGSFPDQLRSIKYGAQVVCGTPGRLCEHLDRRTLKLDQCRTVVLDEADEMLNMGFAEELQRIVSQLPAERQTMLFSATLPETVQDLARRSMRDPRVLTIDEALSIPTEIQHVCYETAADQKMSALLNLLHAEAPRRALVFCHTKAETEQLVERLGTDGFSVGLLNGDLPQVVRTRTLQQFRQGDIALLVATDVAARGIDVEGITHVFNMAVPRAIETYVHRVGRTGRAGHFGQAATFVTSRDNRRFKQMLRDAGVRVEVRTVPQPVTVRQNLRTRYLETLGSQPAGAAWKSLASDLLQFLPAEDLIPLLLARDPAARAVLEAGAPVTQVVEARPVQPKQTHPKQMHPKQTHPKQAHPKQTLRRGGETSHEAEMVRLKINLGRRDRLTAASLVKLVCTTGEVAAGVLGVITVDQTCTMFDIRADSATQVRNLLNVLSYKGRQVRVSLGNRY
ncbi:MAG TPA: DEAD/DEAH box helicase [Candidatus Xenobia bacterium]